MLGPIFNREWLILPRRSRHYLTRSLYLGVLWLLLLTVWQTTIGWETAATLGDLARFGLLAFQVLAYVQLTLLLFFAALSAASTISLEKDRRTFVLLLMTDLNNYEIVLGKLFGSLLSIGIFLAASMPVYALLMLLGGIDVWQIVGTMLILGMTAVAAGSLGGVVALWREKTFQAIALTLLFVVLYLCLVQGLALLPYLPGRVTDGTVQAWQGALDPFRALAAALDPPADDELVPAAHFALAMLAAALLLNGLGILRLRVWNPSGEPIMQPDKAETAAGEPASVHAAPGRVRRVWRNPILWREIATRAYGRRPLLVKAAYGVVLALVCYYTLFAMEPRPWAAAYSLVPIGILSLLLISAQAVTSITSERDIGALDLLMITDLAPGEFIVGKVFGILYNTKEYIVPPLVLIALHAWRGELGTPPRGYPDLRGTMNVEAALCAAGAFAILMAFTVMLGIHVALRNNNSRFAALNALGTVFFLSVGTMICIYLILINGRFEYQWLSFAGFICAGIGGLWWVLSAERGSAALNLASALCPIAVFYTVTNVLVGKPETGASTDPLMPLLVMGGAFGFALVAMAIPLISEFDVSIGRSSAIGE
jgi:hypothetical protein